MPLYLISQRTTTPLKMDTTKHTTDQLKFIRKMDTTKHTTDQLKFIRKAAPALLKELKALVDLLEMGYGEDYKPIRNAKKLIAKVTNA